MHNYSHGCDKFTSETLKTRDAMDKYTGVSLKGLTKPMATLETAET